MVEPRVDAACAARESSITSSASAASPARQPRVVLDDTISRSRSGDSHHENESNSNNNDNNQAKDDNNAALVVLKYSLAQNELREIVHALYSALEAHEQQADVSRKEAAQLKAKHERWKQEARLEREHARQQVQQCQHDLTWANQQMQQAQMQKGELETENQRLKTQLEEKDKTIDRLNQQLPELISKQHGKLQGGGALGSELEQVAADFSRKEREVYNNMGHVRKATASLQQQGKDMSSQISSLQTQLVDIKELYAECRAFIEESRSPPLLEAKQPDMSTCNDIFRLEQENEDLKVENQALLQRCKHFEDELIDVKNQIAELVQKNGSLKKLIAKFEQSAEDGTQTIECLQESLMKLCDQITNERQHHESLLGKTAEAASEKERQLTQDIEQLQQKLHANENKTEVDIVSMMLKQLEADRQTHSLDASSTQNDASQKSHEVHREPRSTHQDTGSQTKVSTASLARAFQQDPTSRTNEPAEIIDDIEDIDDDEVSIMRTPSKPRTTASTQAKTPATAHAKIQPTTTMCRSCGEEPFGFMVKCQKCKDPFHAGCVKPPNGKRRVSHVFKCSTCSLQRPTKVTRHESFPSVTPDVSSKLSRRPAVP